MPCTSDSFLINLGHPMLPHICQHWYFLPNQGNPILFLATLLPPFLAATAYPERTRLSLYSLLISEFSSMLLPYSNNLFSRQLTFN